MEVVVSAVAEPLLSAALDVLFEKLRSIELFKFPRMKELQAEVKKWEASLGDINALLAHAERRQAKEKSVKLWLDDLQDLAYDIEDLLDEFSTEILKRQVTGDSSHVPSFLRRLSPAYVAFKKEMASKIEGITGRLERINETQKRLLRLTRIVGEQRSKPKEILPKTSLVNEPDIYGRNDDKEALVQMLLRHERGINAPFSVIPILGMGGIGKTTLAQLVYNDRNVKDHFDLKGFVCVSENFEVVEVTRAILESITSKADGLKDLNFNSLQEKLKEELSQKKFLLILDDVWEQDYIRWDDLCRPLNGGAIGSKIVITTRNERVASMAAGNVPPYRVRELPDDECLLLLARHALGAKNFDSRPDLKNVALEMVKTCKGLPLATKVLGGLLRTKRSRDEWERVLRSETWNSTEFSSNILPVLKLSYDDLPSCLKPCFVYCAIFPKDHEFHRDELVSLWMAEGLLQIPQGGEPMEDVGVDYFEDLVLRSLIQSSSKNTTSYVLHDLISDLAQSMGGEVFYNCEKRFVAKSGKIRHAFFTFREEEFAVLALSKTLRTIFCCPRLPQPKEVSRFFNLLMQSKCLRVLSLCGVKIKSLPDSIGDLKYLRHLDLSYTNIERLPESTRSLFNLQTLLLCGCSRLKKLSDSIGNLKHLQHLDLSRTEIERLPESICSLFNLQTLLLCDCSRLKKLPEKIGNLVNLRCLNIRFTEELQSIPSGIGNLINLQELPTFVVKEGDGSNITALKNLNNLRGILDIDGLDNVNDPQDAKLANLNKKQGLVALTLRWNNDGRNDKSVFELLKPHQNLRWLAIDSYGGLEFPSWLSDPSFSNLESLYLLSCGNVKSLRALHNFQNLSHLSIEKCSSVVSLTPGGFPCSLKTIYVYNCDALECFPIINCHDSQQSLLEVLSIVGCASLRYFAANFKFPISLKEFQIIRCKNLLSLPDGLMTLDDGTGQCQSHIEFLHINECEQLTSFPAGNFPATLKSLNISGATQLKSIPDDIFCNTMALDRFCLKKVNISVLPSSNSLQSLRELIMGDCAALESLPNQMDTLLPSLRLLSVSRCPCLVTLTQEGGLSKNLTTLHIGDCENLRQPVAEWRLHHLSSLQFLIVYGVPSVVSDVLSFSDDNCCLLPTSLRSLRIGDFMNLQSLGLGLQKLTYLDSLAIYNCPKIPELRPYPEEALPSSLKEVKINGYRLEGGGVLAGPVRNYGSAFEALYDDLPWELKRFIDPPVFRR